MTPYEADVQSVVIVPREPTDTMVACGEQASQMMEWQVRAAWAAMVLSAGRWLPTQEYEGPDRGMHDTEIPDDDQYDDTPLDAEDVVIVPRKPTDTMLREGYRAFHDSPSASFAGRVPDIYAAMISAVFAENGHDNLRSSPTASMQSCGCVSFPSPVKDHCVDCYDDRGGSQNK